MSTTPPPDKLTALEKQRLQLQQQLAEVEAAAAAEKKRGDEQAAIRAAEQAEREQARRALLQQEAARLAAERLKQEQEAADNPTPPPATAATAIAGAVNRVAATPPPQAPPPAQTAPPEVETKQPEPTQDTAPRQTTDSPTTVEPQPSPAAPARQPAPTLDTQASPKPSQTQPAGSESSSKTQPVQQPPASPGPPVDNAPTPEAPPTTAAPAIVAPAIVAAMPGEPIPKLDGEDETDETEDTEEAAGGFSIKRWIDGSPPVLVSTVFHAVGLVILGLMTLALQKPEPQGVVMQASEAVDESMLEELSEVELEPQEIVELENFAVTMTEPDPGMIAFSDITAAVNEVDASNMGDVQLQQTTIGDIGALFGKDGKGMSDVSDGVKAASFFGAKSAGSRFVFVVDNSNSMGGGKFETVMNELVRSIDALSPRQRFYVIFFSDTAYPLFYPDPAYGMVAATPQNKTRLKSWLYTVEMCLRTKGRGSMEQALKMSPDAIYILGDGAFTDDTAKMLTAPHERTTVIHTVGMQVNDRGREELTAIAKANNGTFRSAQPSAEARAMAKANPIKRNNTRGPIWGIELPGRKK